MNFLVIFQNKLELLLQITPLKGPEFSEPFCGDYRSRTGDLLHAMQTL